MTGVCCFKGHVETNLLRDPGVGGVCVGAGVGVGQ